MPRPIVRPFIEFGGIKFFLDAGSGGYYRAAVKTARAANLPDLLHRAIWQAAHGPIPPKWHIHHADHDRTNNDLSNLRALSPRAHKLEHGAAGAALRTASERADETRAMWAARTPRAVVCVGCGTEFESIGMRAMFCSKPCRRRHYNKVRGY